jgi:hypothetical protein
VIEQGRTRSHTACQIRFNQLLRAMADVTIPDHTPPVTESAAPPTAMHQQSVVSFQNDQLHSSSTPPQQLSDSILPPPVSANVHADISAVAALHPVSSQVPTINAAQHNTFQRTGSMQQSFSQPESHGQPQASTQATQQHAANMQYAALATPGQAASQQAVVDVIPQQLDSRPQQQAAAAGVRQRLSAFFSSTDVSLLKDVRP